MITSNSCRKNALSLLEKIFNHAEEQPDKIALKYLEDDYQGYKTLTYKELKDKIRVLAYEIHTRGHQQANTNNEQLTILLLFASSIEYIVSFLAVLYSGHIAVTAYPPNKRRRLQRLTSIIQDSKPAMLLTTSKIKDYCLTDEFKPSDEIDLVCYDAIDFNTNNAFTNPGQSLDDIAFLQYTSGSTGTPKGVIVTHKNLVANLEVGIDILKHESLVTCVSWLPIFHDMGLIGNTLLPLYAGGCCVFMAPLTFLKKPLFWLQKMCTEKATYSMAPNFAYALAAKAFEHKNEDSFHYDFSSVRHLINGAEPVKMETIEYFEQLLTPYGLVKDAVKPGYGMAEATLIMSINIHDTRALTVNKNKLEQGFELNQVDNSEITQLVRCGKIHDSFMIKIVDPETHKLMPDCAIGELWISGASVTQGYYKNHETTEKIYQAYTSDTNEGPFMRTGDLGFIDTQGHLIICGRSKDLIIVNGRNIFPQDIENVCIKANPQLINDGAAAFSITKETSEQCVIVSEVKGQLKPEEYELILAQIQKAVLDECNVIIHDILLIPKRNLLKTTSGKVQRDACKNAYLNGEFEIIAQLKKPSTATENFLNQTLEKIDINHWLRNWIAQQTSIPLAEIDSERAFAEYGLESATLSSMIEGLSHYIKHPLDVWLLWEHPNINALDNYISNLFKK